MGDPQQIVKMDAISVDGLEEIFVEQDSSGLDTAPTLDTPTQVTSPAEDSPTQVVNLRVDSTGQDSGETWTVEEAAKELGISSKTVLRRLQKGTLNGYKVAGQFGLEWRVVQDSPGQPTATPTDRSAQDSVEVIQLRTKVELMSSELKELKQQLQGASFRNGYLEAQSESYQNQLKLLTDSKHDSGWWSRFCSWFKYEN